MSGLVYQSKPETVAPTSAEAAKADAPNATQRLKGELRGQGLEAQDARLAPEPAAAPVQMKKPAGNVDAEPATKADSKVGADTGGSTQTVDGAAPKAETPAISVAEVRSELQAAMETVIDIEGMSGFLDQPMEAAKKALNGYVYTATLAINKGTQWQRVEGAEAMEALRVNVDDFMTGQILENSVGQIPVVGTVATIAMDAHSAYSDSQMIDSVQGSLQTFADAVKGYNFNAVGMFMVAAGQLASSFGYHHGASRALFGPHALGNLSDNINHMFAELRDLSNDASSQDALGIVSRGAKLYRTQAQALKADIKAMKRHVTQQVKRLEAEIGVARTLGNALYDKMIVDFIRQQAKGNEDLVDMVYGDGGHIHVGGTAIYDKGRGQVVLLTHDLRVGKETRKRYTGMTWKDLRKEKIPVSARFNNSEGPEMEFVQDASGDRRVYAVDPQVMLVFDAPPKDVYAAIWERLDGSSFSSLGVTFG